MSRHRIVAAAVAVDVAVRRAERDRHATLIRGRALPPVPASARVQARPATRPVTRPAPVRLLHRVAASPAARDLREVRPLSPAVLAVLLLVLAAVITVVWATNGHVATWSGYQPVSDLAALAGTSPLSSAASS